jgi:GT2 family glycosyltransferase
MLRSIDHEVGTLYVVDNGGGVPRDMEYSHLPAIFVADAGFNFGVAASWNLIIRANIHQRWWLICNNDLTFEKGVLDRLVSDVEAHLEEPNISMVEMGNESWGNHFGAFAVNDLAIDTVGWFDENLHPIYFEDTDWKRRAERIGIRMNVVRSSTNHLGNQSWKNDPALALDNSVSWRYNSTYFDEKYAAAEPDLRYWRQPSIKRLRETSWRV